MTTKLTSVNRDRMICDMAHRICCGDVIGKFKRPKEVMLGNMPIVGLYKCITKLSKLIVTDCTTVTSAGVSQTQLIWTFLAVSSTK